MITSRPKNHSKTDSKEEKTMESHGKTKRNPETPQPPYVDRLVRVYRGQIQGRHTGHLTLTLPMTLQGLHVLREDVRVTSLPELTVEDIIHYKGFKESAWKSIEFEVFRVGLDQLSTEGCASTWIFLFPHPSLLPSTLDSPEHCELPAFRTSGATSKDQTPRGGFI